MLEATEQGSIKWKMYPWGSTLNLYHHVPAMYVFFWAYGGIFSAQTARVLSQGYPHFPFESSFSCFKPDQEYEKLLEQVRPFGKDLALETLRRDESGPAAIDLFQDLSVFDEPVASASVGCQACNEGWLDVFQRGGDGHGIVTPGGAVHFYLELFHHWMWCFTNSMGKPKSSWFLDVPPSFQCF